MQYRGDFHELAAFKRTAGSLKLDQFCHNGVWKLSECRQIAASVEAFEPA